MAGRNKINSLQVLGIDLVHLSSLCPTGDCLACTSSTRAVWTNGWPPAGSVQSVELTLKHSWTLTADEIQPSLLCQSLSRGSCFLPSRLAGPPSPCWVLCQMSPDFMWHLFWLMLYWAKTGQLTPWEAPKDSLYTEAHLSGSKRHKYKHTCSCTQGLLVACWL